MRNKIWLGLPGSEQLLPDMGRRFTEEDIEETRERRAANGKLKREVLYTKKLFKLNYNFVTNAILQQLKQLYQLGTSNKLSLKIEQEDGSIEEYEVVFRPFGRSRYLVGNQWFWEGISIELEEI